MQQLLVAGLAVGLLLHALLLITPRQSMLLSMPSRIGYGIIGYAPR